MKKYLFSSCCLYFFLLFSSTAYGQRSAFDIGFGCQFYQASGVTLYRNYDTPAKIDTGLNYREGGAMESAIIGKSLPLIRFHKFAFAANPSIIIGLGDAWDFSVPVYAVLKYGTDATKKRETKFGAAAGIGQALNGYASHFSTIYWGPTWMSEVSMNISFGMIKLRATGNFNELERDYGYKDGAVNTGHHVLKQPLSIFLMWSWTY